MHARGVRTVPRRGCTRLCKLVAYKHCAGFGCNGRAVGRRLNAGCGAKPCAGPRRQPRCTPPVRQPPLHEAQQAFLMGCVERGGGRAPGGVGDDAGCEGVYEHIEPGAESGLIDVGAEGVAHAGPRVPLDDAEGNMIDPPGDPSLQSYLEVSLGCCRRHFVRPATARAQTRSACRPHPKGTQLGAVSGQRNRARGFGCKLARPICEVYGGA